MSPLPRFGMKFQVIRLLPHLSKHQTITLAADLDVEWRYPADAEEGVAVHPASINEADWRRIQQQQRALLGVLAASCSDWIAWSMQEHRCTRGLYWQMGHRDDEDSGPRWPMHDAYDRCEVSFRHRLFVEDEAYREMLPSLTLSVPNTDEAGPEWMKRLRQMLAEIVPRIQ
jgi:hypothetical protein